MPAKTTTDQAARAARLKRLRDRKLRTLGLATPIRPVLTASPR